MSDPTTPDSSSSGTEPGVASNLQATRMQTVVAAGVLLTAAALALGAIDIPSNAGYSGVGPNFLPWLVAGVLALCGGVLLWEARSGGFRAMEEPNGAARADKPAFVWVSAGLLLNAALCCGKRNTPVDRQQKATDSAPVSAASLRHSL